MRFNKFTDWLSQRRPREQLAVRVGLGLLALLLVWRVGLAPGLQVWSLSDQLDAQLDRQWAEMQTMQAEVRSLSAVAKVEPSTAMQSLQTLAATLGPSTQFHPLADRVTVQFTAATPQALADFLAQARVQANARALQAHWQSRQGKWDGQLVLSLPAPH